MAGIFISYRQSDAKAWAIGLRDDLAHTFGDDQVFLDKDTLHAGNWREQIDRALDRCNVVLIVIGPRWLTIADEQNRPRLSLPDDVHRQEVALALSHHAATVIPVLVDDAAMPRAEQLPEDLRSLCDQQAYKIGDTKARRQADLEVLVHNIQAVGGLTVLQGTNGGQRSGKPEEFRNTPAPVQEQTVQPLPPGTYAIIALIAGLIGIGLLFFYIMVVPRLIATGIQEKVFYLLLVPWGLSCAVFLFGAMRSYVVIRQQHIGTGFELGGPVALFCLVILGGFHLVPQVETFDLTVRPYAGQEAPVVKEGKMTIDFGNLRRTENIADNGEATFKGVARKFWGQTLNARVEVDGYETGYQSITIDDQVVGFGLKKEHVTVTLLTGIVTPSPGAKRVVRLSAEGQRGEGQATPNGEFSFRVQGKEGERIRLRAYIGEKMVYDEYQILPGPVTVELSE